MPTVKAGLPTKTPIAAPTKVPYPAPSASPTSTPSKVPIPVPTPVPTIAPTASDTVAVAATVTMDGLDASAITDDDIAAIKTGLAEVIDGVSASHIIGVTVTDASTRRRRRSLLGTAATVSFTVQVSLSTTTFTDASDLVSTVSSTLTSVESDSSTLLTEIKAAATSTSNWDSVTGVSGTTSYVVTRSPTSVPTPAPTLEPTLEPTLTPRNKGSREASLDAMVYGIIGGVGAFLLAAGAAWHYKRTMRKHKKYALHEDLGSGLSVESFSSQHLAIESSESYSIDLESSGNIAPDLETSGYAAPSPRAPARPQELNVRVAAQLEDESFPEVPFPLCMPEDEMEGTELPPSAPPHELTGELAVLPPSARPQELTGELALYEDQERFDSL
mmetsp:Transcript_104166/g.300273  ORF Transcript_104166/g.300273 Transcript_104166/m.300273 type:complete len:387 (+) Transcript_104166:4325-5485(+)